MSKTLSKNYDLKDLKVAHDTLVAQIFLPKDLLHFDGHFDGMPILPGIVQAHWAIDLACKHLSVKGCFSGIEVLKFTQVISPESVVTLDVSYHAEKGLIVFYYSSSKGAHSNGRVKFI